MNFRSGDILDMTFVRPMAERKRDSRILDGECPRFERKFFTDFRR
jgi:hypothetical protein